MNATRGAYSPQRCSCASTISLVGQGRPYASIAVLLAAASWAVPGPAAWAQIEGPLIIAPDGASGDQFGWSIAVSANTAVIGAWLDTVENQYAAGSVSFAWYVGDPGQPWMVSDDPVDADPAGPNELFGYSVAIDGDLAVVGVRFDTHSGQSFAGSAYVYQGSQGNWAQVDFLTAPTPLSNAEFGFDVAISGDTIVVGAPAENLAGAVYVFEPAQPNQWEVAASFHESVAFRRLGWSVAIEGDRLLVGEPGFNAKAGRVRVYERADSVWSAAPTPYLTAGDPHPEDSFGVAIAMDADRVVVGAGYADGRLVSVPDEDPMPLRDTGAAYVFNLGVGTEEIAKLVASDGQYEDQFGGESVAIRCNTIVVGASFDDDNGNVSGAAYVYRGSFDAPIQELVMEHRKLVPGDNQEGDYFGRAVALVGNAMLIGAFGVDIIEGETSVKEAGAAYVYLDDECPGDTNYDDVVNVTDLLNVILAWGPCQGCDCQGVDTDDNGVVNVVDLVDVVLGWGVCPEAAGSQPESLEQKVTEAGLVWPDDWDEFMDKMENGTQQEEDNYRCWMLHYLQECTLFPCSGPSPACPGSDPYGLH